MFFDESTYKLSFSNEVYKISTYADSPKFKTKTRNLVAFLEVCEMISKITSFY